MGNLDVSDVLLDPDFTSPLTIIRRKACVDGFGTNKLEETSIPTIGVVQPATGRTIQRLPEALRVANTSSFWVKIEMLADGCSTYPDIIFFKGQRYAVQVVFDYTNWGQGWCEGTCVREKPAA